MKLDQGNTLLENHCAPADRWGFPGHFAVPGFVNAHTHLELTFQLGQADPNPPDFVRWVDQLVEGARGSTEETYRKSYRDGLEQSLRLGSTTVIDHCRRASYLLPESESSPLRLTTAFDYARKHDLLLCGHLAETKEELTFIRDGTGPFVHFLSKTRPRDIDDYTPPGCSPVEHLHQLGGLSDRTLAAHCNYLTDHDIELLARTKTSVVHCPGSYHFFGHSSFRLLDLLDAGVNVCLGTDSLASNDTLSILHAMRQIRQSHPELPEVTILEMGTIKGHKALDPDTDRLPDDFCILPWSSSPPPSDPTPRSILHELLSSNSHPTAVIIDDEIVWSSPLES